MQDNIPDALIAAFERHYGIDWNDPQLRNERLAWRAAWAEATKPCLHQIQEPAPVLAEDTDTTSKEQYRRMLDAACHDLGLINEALDLDPNDGGADPILEAIAALKALADQAAPAAVAVPDEIRAALIAAIEQMEHDALKIELEWGTGRNLHGLDVDGDLPPALVQARAALAATPAAAPTYIEVRECIDCGHIGINDADDSEAACNKCDWQGESPVEDKCPGCNTVGTMTSACPKCGARTSLIAETTLQAEASTPAADPKSIELEATEDMLSSARMELDMVRKALGVSVEPHQSLFERMVEAAESKAAAPFVLPEPVANLHCNDECYVWARASEAGQRMRFEQPIALYTEQQVRALLATGGQAQAVLTGELIEAVDAWFARNTGLGGCSDKDVAELAAIFAAPQAQADARDAWPSIESAPKDGTWIQLWRTPEPEESPVNSTPLVIGRWSDEEESFVWPDDQFYDPFTEHGKAKADQMVEAMQTYASNKFTHWAPLSMPSVHRAAIAAAKGK